ncbi:MAG: amidohydrolase [Rikenellaceae bacterium]
MLKLGIIQLATAWHDKEKNFEKARYFIENNDADIFVLPEMFTTGFTSDVELCAEDMGGISTEWFKKTTQETNKALMGSIIISLGEGKYCNRMIFAAPGCELEYYDKRHLFRMGGEHKKYTGGEERKIFNYKGFRILPQICYDLRFPVFSRNTNDYDLAIYCACWPEPRTYAWSALLRARAIENQCYLVGVNMVGEDPKLKYKGGSAVIDFAGNYLTQATDWAEDVKIVELDIDALNGFKENFPAWMDADNFEIKF